MLVLCGILSRPASVRAGFLPGSKLSRLSNGKGRLQWRRCMHTSSRSDEKIRILRPALFCSAVTLGALGISTVVVYERKRKFITDNTAKTWITAGFMGLCSAASILTYLLGAESAIASAFVHTCLTRSSWRLLTAGFGNIRFLHFAFNAVYFLFITKACTRLGIPPETTFAFFLSGVVWSNFLASNVLVRLLANTRIVRLKALRDTSLFIQGSSGGLLTLLGLASVSDNSQYRLIFLPTFTFKLKGIFNFQVGVDCLGMLSLLPRFILNLRIAFAAHLAGLGIGRCLASDISRYIELYQQQVVHQWKQLKKNF